MAVTDALFQFPCGNYGHCKSKPVVKIVAPLSTFQFPSGNYDRCKLGKCFDCSTQKKQVSIPIRELWSWQE